MAFDAYLQIDGIKGESTDSEHKDWIEVLSYSPATPQPASVAVAATHTRTTHQDYSIVKYIDKASPKLYEAVSTGKHIPKVVVELMRASGGSPVKYLEIKMTDVIISNVSSAGRGGQAPPAHPSPPILQNLAKPVASPLLTESVSFNYGSIQWTYTQQKRSDGSGGGNVAGGWNLSKGASA
jgi:type VI secretion system secreted protein Hcp